LFFLSLLFWQLDRVDPGRQHVGKGWIWPLVFMVWSNMHGGVVIGLAVIGCYIFTNFSHSDHRRQWVAWGLLCAGATMIGPNGWKVYGVICTGIKNMHEIAEWVPTPWVHFKTYWFVLPVFWVGYLWEAWRSRSISFFELGMSVLFSWESMRHVLFVPFFMVCIVPFMITRVCTWQEVQSLTRRMSKNEGRWICLTAFLFGGLAVRAGMKTRGGIADNHFPVEACDFIEQKGIKGIFFHPYDMGGYWMWRFETNRPVFMDGRYPTVSGYLPLWVELTQAQHGSPEQWHAFLRRYHVDGALLPYPGSLDQTTSFLAYFPPKEWALVYEDKLCLLFLRRPAYPNDLK